MVIMRVAQDYRMYYGTCHNDSNSPHILNLTKGEQNGISKQSTYYG